MIDLTNGIRQSDENPLASILDPGAAEAERTGAMPFEEVEAERRKQAQASLVDSWERLDRALIDPDAFLRDNPQNLGFAFDKRKKLEQRLSGTFLRLANGGQAFPSQIAMDIFRDNYAEANFNGRGKGDYSAFFSEAQKAALGRKTHTQLMADLGGAAGRSLESMLETPAGKAALISGVTGKPIEGFSAWRQEAEKKPGYDKRHDAEYLETYNAVRREIAETIEPVLGPAGDVLAQMKQGELDVFAAYGQFDGDIPAQEKFLAALTVLVRTLPAEEQTSVWNGFEKAVSKTAQDLPEKLFSAVQNAVRGSGDNERLDEVRAEMAAQEYGGGDTRTRKEKDIQQRDFIDALRKIRDQDYDPIKVLNPDNFFARVGEKALYSTPETVSYLGIAALSTATGSSFPVMRGMNERIVYGELRDSIIQAGGSKDLASSFAYDAAPWASIPYTAIDYLGGAALLKKLPFLEKALHSATNRIGSSTVRFAMRTGGVAGFETVAELGQDSQSRLVQEVASALRKDIPGTVWKNGKDGYLDGFWENQAVTFLSMLPLSIGAGMEGKDRDLRAKIYASASDTQLQAFGYSPATIADMRAATARGVGSLDAAIDKAQKNRNPFSPEAKAAVAQLEAEAAQAKALAEEAQKSGVLPKVSGNRADGYTLTDGTTGEVIGHAATHEDVMRIASAHSSQLSEDRADMVDYFASLVEASDQASVQTTKEGDAMRFDVAPMQRMSEAEAALLSPGAEERFASQAAMQDKLAGGDGKMLFTILGLSVTDIEALKRDVRDTTNYIRGGGTVKEVVHEKTHAFWREARMRGRLTFTDGVNILKAYNEHFRGRTVRQALPQKGKPADFKRRAVSLIPDDVKDADITEEMVDEAISQIIEIELFRAAKTGSRRGKGESATGAAIGVESKLTARNVTSFLKVVAPQTAKRLSSFIEAVRTYFALVFGRTAIINKAAREGRFDEASKDEFISKLFGLSVQDEMNAQADHYTDEILGGGTLEDDPFSLGETMAFSLGLENGFYSQLERVVESKVPNTATPSQILATVDPSRGTGVKAEEIKWTGLKQTVERLAAENGGKVPKQALLDHLRNEGRVRFNETTLADNPEVLKGLKLAANETDEAENRQRFAAMDALEAGGANRVERMNLVDTLGRFSKPDSADYKRVLARAQELAPDFDWNFYTQATKDAAAAKAAYDQAREMAPKYQDYKLGGGDNYREVVLTMPEQGKVTYTAENVVPLNPGDHEIVTSPGLFWYFEAPGQVFQILKRTHPTREEALAYILEEKQPGAPADQNFTSRHFEQVPNYVAHMRLDDRTDATGAEGTFIEEIQSDRHQKGRSKGYVERPSDTLPEGWGIDEADGKFKLWREGTAGRWLQGTFSRREQALEDAWSMINQEKIPDAPFRKDWPLHMFKRALRDAVEMGKDWIGWTDGDTQAERFDLSRQVDAIDAWRMDDERGLYDVNVTLKGGKMKQFSNQTADMLPDLIGKEMAEKIVNDPEIGDKGVHLKGLDLKVGGEGMKGFYDKILPSEVSKYVKQWGAKVEAGSLGGADAGGGFEIGPEGVVPKGETPSTPFWKVSITEAMRTGVEMGQAAFSIADRGVLPGGFPENLADAVKSTSLAKLKSHAGYNAAKKEADGAAAVGVVLDTAKIPQVARELMSRVDPSKPVILLPVIHRDIGRRLNAIPPVYAKILGDETSWAVSMDIVKKGGAANTGAGREARSSNIQTFAGEIDREAQYILVDDTFTSGDTLMALYEFITKGGGTVAAISTIAAGRYQNYIAHRPQDAAKLLDRAGVDRDGFRREFGFPVEQLTGSEVYRFANLDRGWKGVEGLRSRIDPGGSSRRDGTGAGGAGSPQGGSFSLGPARMADDLIAQAQRRVRNPKERLAIYRDLTRNLAALRRDTDLTSAAFGKNYTRKAIEDPRATASIRKESAMREAIRRAELEEEVAARWGAILEDDELVQLKAQPVHAALSDPKNPLKGRLRSKSRFIKDQGDMFTSSAEYDGSELANRTLFGGTLTPDQAAAELFEAGLIRESSPEAMWSALEREAQSVQTMKRHRAQGEEQLREARKAAKREAAEWEKGRIAEEKKNYSTKARLLRSMAMLDGIINALPVDLRGRVGGYTQLAKLNSDEKRLEYLKGRLQRSEEVIEAYLRREYGKMMDKLLERAKPAKDKAGKKPKGKAGYTVHELFAMIPKAMKWDEETVEAEASKREKIVAAGETGKGNDTRPITAEEEAHLTLEAALIRLVGNWNDRFAPHENPDTKAISYKKIADGADAARRAAAVEEATRIFEAGYATFRLEKLLEIEDQKIRRNHLRGDTGKAGTEKGRKIMQDEAKTFMGSVHEGILSFFGFEQMTGWVFGDASTEAKRLVGMEMSASNAKEDALQETWESIEELFIDLAGGRGTADGLLAQASLRGQQLRESLADVRQDTDKNGKPQDPVGIKGTNGVYYSQLEAITATLMWRQADGKRHMIGKLDDNGQPIGEWHYDQAFVDALEAGLSPEAHAVRQFIADNYAGEYAKINPVFRRINGISLPKNDLYAPLTLQPLKGTDPVLADPLSGTVSGGVTFTPGSLLSRGTSIAQPKFLDALKVFESHTMQIQHWLAYAEFTKEANALLNNRDVMNSVAEKAGQEAVSLLGKWVEFFGTGGNRDASANLAMTIDMSKALNRMAAAALVGRASVLVVQSTQLGAAIHAMPVGSYLKRIGKLMTGQMGWGTALRSEYIQRRLKQMPPIVRQAMAGLRSGDVSQLKHQVQRIGRLIGGADALFTAGTYAMIYDYNLKVVAPKLGVTGAQAEAYAHQQAEIETDRVAQPTRPGARSFFENTSTHPAMRLAWAFASESRQKLVLWIYAMAKKPWQQKVRATALTWLVGGLFASVIRAAMRDARDDGEDDEVFDERNWNPSLLLAQTITSPLRGIPFLGEGLEALIMKAMGEYHPEGNLFSVGGKASSAIMDIPEWGSQDASKTLKDVEDLLTAVGVFHDGAASATSVMHIVRDIFGVADNLTP